MKLPVPTVASIRDFYAFEEHVRGHEKERLSRSRPPDATENADKFIRQLKESVGIGGNR